MNLWIAYLNLENMYGTPETLAAVLTRAVQQNDALLVYQQMVNIYVQSGKIQVSSRVLIRPQLKNVVNFHSMLYILGSALQI